MVGEHLMLHRPPPSPTFTARVRSARSVLSIASVALDEAVHTFGAVGAAIELHARDGRPLLCIATPWFERASLERYVASGYRSDPCPAWVRQSEAPLVTSDRLSARAARELAAAYGCPDASARHIFVAPVFGDGEVIGVLRAAYERAANEGTNGGLALLASHVSVALARLGFSRTDEAPLDALTPGQHRVAALVARGLTNAEIARELTLSLDGVKKHVKLALAGLGLANRAALAVAVTRSVASAQTIGDPGDAPELHVIRSRAGGGSR